MSTQLFGAIKEARDAAITHYKSEKTDEQVKEEIKGMNADEIIQHFAGTRDQRVIEAIDKAIGGTLDAVEEHYEEIININEASDEESSSVTITSGLSDSFFEAINS